MNALIQVFLAAPSTQLSPKVVDAAKGWASCPPTVEQCDEVLRLMDKYHSSRTARNVLYAIRLEVEASMNIVYDKNFERPLK